MDNLLEQGQKIRLTPFDKPEETKAGYIKSLENEKIIIEFNESINLQKLSEYKDKEIDVSCSNEKCLIKFTSTITAIENNIFHIEKNQKFEKIQRREYTRINTEFPVTFVDEKGNILNCYTSNISGGGMQVISNCSIVLGPEIQARLKLKNREINAVFKVLRIEKSNENNEYFIAGVFKKIENIDRIYLVQSCFKKQLEQRCIGI